MGKTPTKVVEAAGASSSSMSPSGKDLAAEIERQMSEETQRCFDEGVTDPQVVLERKLAIREKVKDDARKAEAEAIKAAAKADAEAE